MTKLASWNVNSVKARLGHLLDWLKAAQPDIVCLQEIKCTEVDFPRLEIKGLGYDAVVVGQKSYNGVAILSREPASDVVGALPGDGKDDHARYVEATVGGLRVASVYLPNGNPAPGEKFAYKLAWMKRLDAHARNLLDRELPFALAGDFNVAPADDDVYDPAGWKDDALCRPESRTRFRALLNLGITDAFRALHGEGERYTYWDYMQRRFETDEGLRIDHILLSPQATDRLIACDIDKSPRSRDKPSDHTPIWCELAAR
ncbi:MAG: exodeoxyribonuclease III [Alphaproteobacteria bacterium]|nr:exodeoxyribonuclease III [Alphaproteobacteria bacterium]